MSDAGKRVLAQAMAVVCAAHHRATRAAEVLPLADRERLAAYIRDGYILARLEWKGD